jgi:hypothetical protein
MHVQFVMHFSCHHFPFALVDEHMTVLRITRFLTVSIVWNSRSQKTLHFGNWICFYPQVWGKIPTLLGPLERANLNHWMMDTVQKPSNSECHTPSSKPFRIYMSVLIWYLKREPSGKILLVSILIFLLIVMFVTDS